MISQQVKDEIVNIAKRYPDVKEVMLFGSRAHGDHEERSDIDLAIVAPNLSNRDWYLLIDTLEEELSTLLNFDFVRWESALKN
ncbi:MAG: nucleotidyltransferase domain-containing protein [Bacillaceae bacterium]|nr:nucleotidyltransferase domain-containing protein [Bacillaceae bacterium]